MKLEVKDAARLLGVGPQRVRQLEQAGTLRAERTMGGTRLFDQKDVEKLKAQREKNKR
jgi:excisionase family DNA binding protein